jgi:indole-3-acetate monooxygenase
MKEQENSLTGDQILANSIALAPTIREGRDEIERERRLPVHFGRRDEESRRVSHRDAPRMGRPRARSDESVANNRSALDRRRFGRMVRDDRMQRRLLDRLSRPEGRARNAIDVFTANALTLTGRALKVKGGYRVSGHWPFGSGCQHSTWLVGGCMVYEGDRQSCNSEGVPVTRQCYFPTRDAQILDTWYTTGLRGSGSCDFAINDYFVPEERTFSYQDVKFYRSGPLYRFFANLLFHFPGPALGVARAAIDTLIDAGTRPRRLTTVGGKLQAGELREDAFVQDAVGRAEAILAAARAYLFTTMSEVWDELVGGREIPPRLLAHFLMVHSHVYAMSTQAVELVYKARGGSSVYSSGLLDRCMRDALTMNQHVTNSLRSYGMAGRILLGLPGEFLLF